MILRSTMIAFAMLLSVGARADAQILYGISNGFGSAVDNQIYQINPADGAISNSVQVTVAGQVIGNSLAMAAHPTTGQLFAVLQYDGTASSARRLVTIDPATGIGTEIGNLGRAFASLAFRSNGTLYGVTGDGSAANPETLYTINTANAAIALQFALGNGADGETIAFHPNGLLYHSSGNAAANFESINVDTQVVTPISVQVNEMFAMGFHPGLNQMLGSDIGGDLISIDVATGVRTLIGAGGTVLSNRGLAVVPEPTSIALVGLTSLVGFAIKRRSGRRLGQSAD